MKDMDEVRYVLGIEIFKKKCPSDGMPIHLYKPVNNSDGSHHLFHFDNTFRLLILHHNFRDSSYILYATFGMTMPL